jgi:hypothetical protein
MGWAIYGPTLSPIHLITLHGGEGVDVVVIRRSTKTVSASRKRKPSRTASTRRSLSTTRPGTNAINTAVSLSRAELSKFKKLLKPVVKCYKKGRCYLKNWQSLI